MVYWLEEEMERSMSMHSDRTFNPAEHGRHENSAHGANQVAHSKQSIHGHQQDTTRQESDMRSMGSKHSQISNASSQMSTGSKNEGGA